MSDSIADSLASASAAVETIDAELAGFDTPNPISTDNVDPEKAKELAEKAEKAKSPSEKRRDAIKRAMAKSEKMHGTGKAKAGEPVVSADRTENANLLRGIVEKRVGERDSDRTITTKELNTKEAREHRAALRQRYPGAKLGEIFESFAKWDSEFQRDPVATREAVMAAYLKVSPQNFAKGKPAEYAEGLAGSLQRAQENQRDIEELQPFIDKYGKDFPHIMRQIVELDNSMMDDPAGTSARLAANYGAPITAAEQQQHEQKAQHEQARQAEYANVDKALRMLAEHAAHPSIGMPDFDNEDVQNEIANVLADPRFQRSKDRMADLRRAYLIATHPDHNPKAARDANKLRQVGAVTGGLSRSAERGGKSIKGGPGSGTVPGKGHSQSAAAAVARAMGGV